MENVEHLIRICWIALRNDQEEMAENHSAKDNLNYE
jgi:hypothetical protein